MGANKLVLTVLRRSARPGGRVEDEGGGEAITKTLDTNFLFHFF